MLHEPEALMTEPYRIVYSYDDVPSIRKFAKSNKRIRGLMGPFGSGKSSGCLMEIIRRAHEQAPSQDGIRRTRWAIIRNCYDDQTEILTEKRGWQLFKDLLESDKVASLEGEELVFVNPTYYYKAEYSGEMIEFDSEGVNFCVTPDHRLYVSMRNARKKIWQPYCFRKALDVFGNQNIRVKRNATWRGAPSGFPLPFFEWLGFFVAEGSTYKGEHGYQCIITQKNDLDYVRDLFSSAGIFFTEGKRSDDGINFRISTKNNPKSLIILLASLGKSHEKHVPQFVKESTSIEIQSFIKGYLAGDGLHVKNGTVTATSASKRLIDDLQEVAIRAGMVTNVYPIGKIKNEFFINGTKTKQNHQTYKISFLSPKKSNPLLSLKLSKDFPTQYSGWSKKQYSGMVYCLEVPSHIVMVRRKGKNSFNSQTYKQLSDTTIRTVHDWLPPAVFGEWMVTNHNYIITKFPGVHIELFFRALDRPEHVSNLLSMELTGAWINEAREVPWEIVDAVDGRINRYPGKKDGGCTWCGILMDTNPPDENSEWYKFFEVNKPVTSAIFKQPSGLSAQAENLKNLAKNYYHDLAIGKSPQYVRVYIEGQYGYTSEGKVVIEQFNDNVHIALSLIQPVDERPLYAGFDFGLNPSCVLGQITARGRLQIIDEYVSDGMGLENFLKNILIPQLRLNYFGIKIQGGYGDPAGASRAPTDESTCFDVLRDNGLKTIRPCPTNALLPRAAAVENFLTRMIDGEPAMVISPKCVMLRKALNGGYHRQKVPGTLNEFSDVPFKNIFSHVAEALEYLCYYLNDLRKKTERSEKVMGQLGANKRSPVSSVTGML